MDANKTILLNKYFDEFVNEQVKSGKFSSPTEVVQTALRLFEYEELKKEQLIIELKRGEESGFVRDFDREKFLKSLHQKRLAKDELSNQ
ncbi:type II toxin-antitoxin system ParD family antitoxin [Sphingobacterium hungaricum]